MELTGLSDVSRSIERLIRDNQESADALTVIGRYLHDIAKDVNAFASERLQGVKLDRKEFVYLDRSTRSAEMLRKLLDGKKYEGLAAEYGVSATKISHELSSLVCELMYRTTHSNLHFDVKPFQVNSIKAIKENSDAWKRALDIFDKELKLRAAGQSEAQTLKSLWGIGEE